MGILILARENAIYDSINKVYTFILERQLDPDITQIRIESATFVPSTLTDYPHAVYLCSKTIAKLVKGTHISELTTDHLDRNDILCVLQKDNGSEHFYVLKAPLRLELLRHNYVKEVDVYFTDLNGTRLDGVYVPTPVLGTSDADIETLFNNDEITFLIDTNHQNSVLEQTTNNYADVGDYVGHLYSKFPSDSTKLDFLPNQNNAIIYKQMNVNVKSISGSPTVSWEAMTESNSSNNPESPLLGAFTLLMKTSDPLENLEVLWQNGYIANIYIYGGAIQIKHQSTYHSLVSVLPNREYIIQVYWSHVNTGGLAYDSKYWCRVWDFVTESFTSDETVTFSVTQPPSFEGSRKSYQLSTAQSHLKSDICHFCVSKSTESTRDDIVEYFKLIQSGSATVPSVDPNAVDSKWLAEFRTNS
jgi:hypothetical protein